MAIKTKSTSKATTKSINSSIANVNKSLSARGLSTLPNLTGKREKKDKTAKEIYKGISTPEYDSSIDTALDKGIKYYGKQAEDFNESDIRDNQLSLFQKQIDATNAIYADMLASARLEGQGRLGSTRARSAREGTLGSDFGNSAKEATLGFNRGIETSIQNEKSAKIAEILGKADASASAEIAARRQAQKEGLDQYLQFLGTKKERKDQNMKDLAQTFLEQDVSPDELNPKELNKIAKNYGLKTDDIVSTYKKAKKDAETAKAEADAKMRKEMSFNLSEGQDRYEYNPITGEYEKIASKAKTFAPKDGGGGPTSTIGGKYVPGADPTVDAWANGIKSGARKITDIPAKNAALRNAVQVALDSMGENDGKRLELDTNIKLLEDLIANPKVKRISGPVQQFAGGIFGKAALAKNQYNQVKGILSLDNRQKLKGSGAISDFEFKVLSDAATALGRNLSDEDFNNQLTKIRDVFKAAYDRANLIENQQNGVTEAEEEATSGATVNVQSPSGEIGTIPAEDLDEALAEGYIQI